MIRQGLQSWVGLGILGILLVVLFAPLLAGQQTLFWGLPTLQFYPWRAFAFDELQAGRIPFWNPYIGGGAPLLANYQTAVFYPPNWLYLMMDYTYAMNVVAVLHLFVAGLGMWLFTGQLGLSPFGRGVSSLCFALAGYSVARLGSFPTINAVAWMPWVFWGVLSVLEGRKLAHVGGLGLITGFLLLTGHAQSAFYILLAAGGFTLWVSFSWLDGYTRSDRLLALTLTGLGVLLGVGIAAAQLLFTAELLRESQRSGGVDYETLTNLSFAPLRLINFITPNFFGSPADGSYLTPDKGVYFEDAVYIGFLPLIAVMAAVLGWLKWRTVFLESRRAVRSVPFWVVLGLIGLILGLGRYGPVYQVLYTYVPTFDAFREPVRWLLLSVFALCILAGIGVQHWGQSTRVFFWSRLAGAGGAGMFVMATLIGQFNQNDEVFVPVLAGAIGAIGAWLAIAALLTLAQPDESWGISSARWQLAVLVVVGLDLVWAAQGLNPTVTPRFYRNVSLTEPQGRLYWFEDYEEEVKFDQFFDLSDYRKATRSWPDVRGSLLPNLNMLDGVALFNNFDPLQPRYHTRYVELLERQSPATTDLLRAAGIGQVYGDFQPKGWQPVSGGLSSYRARQAPPLVWVVPEAIWSSTEEEVETALLTDTWSPEKTVILRGNQSVAPFDTNSPPLTEVMFFDVLRDDPTHKTYRIVTDGQGFVVLANTWYPGWSVYVDGEKQTLYRANLSFMAVELPAGGGEVTFRYLPTINLMSVWISLIAVFSTMMLIALGLIYQLEDNPLGRRDRQLS